MLCEKFKGQKMLIGIYSTQRSADFILAICRKKRPVSKFVIIRTKNHTTDNQGSVEKWLTIRDNHETLKS